MKNVLFAIAALSALAAAGTASAADLPVAPYKGPVAPASFSGTGCYVGANGGGSSDSSNFTTSVAPAHT